MRLALLGRRKAACEIEEFLLAGGEVGLDGIER